MINKVLWSVVIAGVLAQLIKILIFKFKHKQRFHINDLIVTGSMPSAHSALVTSLVISIYLTEGLTTIFLLAAAFAVVVIRDAFGVRRTAGEEGKIIDKIIRSSKLKIKTFHYSLGHTPAEVTVGIIIGIAASILVYFL
ncbi:divergent PAP2 family protein [Candidatus Woesearchaeota archaeon]|nr:divergent PAP2 family protein [Candidatus Woesearchaeota archaeon]